MVTGAGQGYVGSGPVNGTGDGAGAGAMLVTAGAGAVWRVHPATGAASVTVRTAIAMRSLIAAS
jgi:hypothetical protein